MAQLNPKQYIQTKARSLPVYKCLVNAEWETAKLANVVIMRRHVNGNITAGFYLVDLLCLGVKDTIYFFNEPESAIEERLGGNLDEMFTEAGYDLVHNIIYAGHDFAMDFEIKPHPDFAITKFILEEDNDDVPLVEVVVGDEDGKPHLIVNQPGQYSDALAKLKKHAGKGNYNFTIAVDEDDFDGDDEDDYDENHAGIATRNMDEFALGEINHFDAQVIPADELYDDRKINARTQSEKITLQAEGTLRLLKDLQPGLFEHDDKIPDPDDDFLAEDMVDDDGERMKHEIRFDNLFAGIAALNAEPPATRQVLLVKFAKDNSLNPFIVTNIFEALFLVGDKENMQIVKEYVEKLSPKYPMATLMLALQAIFKDEGTEPYSFIYESNNLGDVFPGEELGALELSVYTIMQVLVKLKNNDLRLAIYYYYFNAAVDAVRWILPVVQFRLSGVALEALKATPGWKNRNE